MENSGLRWEIGEVSVTSVVESDTPTSPRFMFEGVTKEGLAAVHRDTPWLRPFVDHDGYLRQRIQCLVVESGDRRIAVDTCIGNDKPRLNEFWRDLQGPFLDDLAATGYPPESITDVICTHIHVDHVGWNTRLVDGEWIPTFPDARYLFVDTELDHAAAVRADEPDDIYGDSVGPIVDAGLADRVAPTHRVDGAVSLVPTHGHTPGHVSVLIESAGERAIITGDMAHSPLQIADPSLSSRFDTDPDEARRTRERVFPDWADGTTLVIGTHFTAPTAGTMHPDPGGGYRFET